MQISKEQHGETRRPFSEWCRKLEENKRRTKTKDLLRKIEDIKGTFCPRGRESCSIDHVQHFVIP